MNNNMFTGSTYSCLHVLPEKTEKKSGCVWLVAKKKTAMKKKNQLWYHISIYHQFTCQHIFK